MKGDTFIVIDAGCYECGEPPKVLGIYDRRELAEWRHKLKEGGQRRVSVYKAERLE